MKKIASTYSIPSDLAKFIDDGLLELLSETPAEKSVEFHLPRFRTTDEHGRITSYRLVWIHPDFNSQFCHYYDKTPGDSANFYVERDTTDVGDELLELDTVDELVAWLEVMKVQVGA